jgi:hypothetical protein
VIGLSGAGLQEPSVQNVNSLTLREAVRTSGKIFTIQEPALKQREFSETGQPSQFMFYSYTEEITSTVTDHKSKVNFWAKSSFHAFSEWGTTTISA